MDFRNLPRYIIKGASDRFWYQDCYNEIVKIFPEEDPRILFDFLAATSMNATIESNVKNFFKALAQYQQGKPFRGFMPNVIIYLNLSASGKEFPDSGRKVKNFTKAMQGSKSAIVVDIWVMRAFGIRDRRTPGNKIYNQIEEYYQEQAPLLGWEPREMCAATWSGIRTEETKSRATTYEEFIKAEKRQLKIF